jgi:penicillin-binding protein 2
MDQDSRWVSLENAPRGEILDRNSVPLTGARKEDRVIVFPVAVADKPETASGLAEILSVDRSVIDSCLKGGACFLPYIVTPAQKAAIRQKDWSGVMVLAVQFRYGERTLAPQTLGYLGRISSSEEYLNLTKNSRKIYRYDDMVGKTGLELIYEEELKGGCPEQAVRVFADARGNLLGDPGFEVEEHAADRLRRDLILTLDARIQKVVEDTLDRQAVKGAIVVMEAGSGDILAMAGSPRFDPFQPELKLAAQEDGNYFDHSVSLYQPGSVFKIVIAAAALEEGTDSLNSHFNCRGEKEELISCWNKTGHGEIDFTHAFINSCNPSFVRIGLNLGAPKIIEYARRLGMENQAVIGYPVPFDRRQDLNLIGAPYNLVNSSVGQGPVLASPMQVASLVNTMVSGGIYREPRLVKEIRKNGGSVEKEFLPDPGKVAISAETAGKLRSLMESVVDEGTGKEAAVPFYGSAGKTGSAQIDGQSTTNAWFAGYAPRVNPRFIAVVMLEGGGSGGESAAPVFREIMEQILHLE